MQAPLSGLLLVAKPQGITSHGVIGRLRRILGLKKIGHAGTLDPMATGLLLVGVGPATRFLHYLTGLDKEYFATIRLGAASSTEDAEGEISVDQEAAAALAAGQSLSDALGLSEVRLLEAIAELTGEIDQIPSSVSAIKVAGQRAYKLVREGKDVDLPARRVAVSEFELLSRTETSDELGAYSDLRVRVRCSSGTYIRALARDLGAKLGTGAHLTQLHRSQIGPFKVDDATELDAAAPEVLLRPAAVASMLFPVLALSEEEAARLRNGQRIPVAAEPVGSHYPGLKEGSELFAALSGDALIALVRIEDAVVIPAWVIG